MPQKEEKRALFYVLPMYPCVSVCVCVRVNVQVLRELKLGLYGLLGNWCIVLGLYRLYINNSSSSIIKRFSHLPPKNKKKKTIRIHIECEYIYIYIQTQAYGVYVTKRCAVKYTQFILIVVISVFSIPHFFSSF